MGISTFLKKYSFLFGLFLFILVLSQSNLREIFQNIRNIKPLYLISAAFITIPMFFNKALCWNYIKRKQGIKYSLLDSFLMYCAGMYIGILTPGRIGEVSKALYLKKDGYSMGRSLVGVIFDRISDFVFLLTFLLTGSLFLLTLWQRQILITLITIIVLLILFVIFLKIGLIKWGFKKLFYLIIPDKQQKSWKLNFQDFINDLKIYTFKNYLIVFIITTFSWVFYYLQMYILARGLNINIPFLYLSIAVTVAGLITLIPVSISGIGTRDAALVALLSPFLVSLESIIIYSNLILLLIVWGALIGLACWWIKPIRV